MNNFINLFKAIADETRVNILILLSKKNMCAKGIAKHLEISEAAVSQHIKILKESQLIIGYKIGYYIIYDLNEERINDAIKFLNLITDSDNISLSLNSKDKNYKVGSLMCLSNCKNKKCSKTELVKEELTMKVCFPVKSNEGVNSAPYNHFGTAPLFIICNTETNEVKALNNGDLGHEHGKCQPIKALSGEIVDAVIVGGIGRGAITKLNSMGIKVFKAIEGNVNENLEAYKKGELTEFPTNHTCSHDGCGH
ncbi:metalloregulator ArsR/SmtB family transcription factor [Clostridium botulinum]|nr:metalloregulator ArsR/SmtB family transcription factor [Clostridium botulinum]NFO99488.1 metalloregulator ArsR/SmtB family transcription factor [Clostridium botulinum]